MSVLSLERLKLPNAMISGFSTPGKRLFIDFIIPNYFKNYKTNHGNMFEKYVFVNTRIYILIFWNIYVPHFSDFEILELDDFIFGKDTLDI